MIIKFNKDLVGSAMFLLLSIVLWLMIPYQIIMSQDRVINAQTFPRLIVGIMGVMSFSLFSKEIYKILMKKKQEYTVIIMKEELKSIFMIGLVILFWVMLFWIPFIIAAILFSGLVLILYSCKKWSYYAITFGVIAIVTVVFQELLNVNLP